MTVNTQTAGSSISLADGNENELVSWTADKEYASVVVSCPEITVGETYLLTAGNSTQEITMDSLIYGGGGMNGQPGSGMPGQSENGMPGQDRKRNDGVPGQKLFTP